MRVLVAVDESEESLHTLTWTLDNLPITANEIGRLVVLHVQKPPEFYTHPIGPAVHASAVVIDSIWKAQQQNFEELLIRVKEICKNNIEIHFDNTFYDMNSEIMQIESWMVIPRK